VLLQIDINIDGVLPNYVIVFLLCYFSDHNYIFSVYRNLPKYHVKHQYYIGTNQILKYNIKIDIYHNERLNCFDLWKHKKWQESLLP